MVGKVNARPTKEFFIDMLTRDIRLEHAIIDLTDNCIDGALTKCPTEDFTDLWIRLEISPNQFKISDNCGGFSLETAREYAFRFGRPKGRKDVDHSVGRFGVGMKRSLFKIGEYFKVESKCGQDHFIVEVDVNEWSTDEVNWDFDYRSGGELINEVDEDGTVIVVSNLHDNIKGEFSLSSFLTYLKAEVEKKHEFNLSKGISIFINNQKLGSNPVKMLFSENLKPAYKELEYGEVKVRIYVGIGEASPDLAGWYIYCNDRLVVEREKTNLTGWEGRVFEESDMIKFHHTYAMFRGVVFFDSKDPKLLPLTTTKTGIDSNSAIYRAVKAEMLILMKQVIGYLKTLKSDEDRDVVKADTVDLEVKNLRMQSYPSTFKAPTLDVIAKENRFVNISFKKDRSLVEKVGKSLGVNTNKEIGEQTFDYYLKMEVKE